MVKTDAPIDSPEAFAARFTVSRETLGKLGTYEVMLKRWQKTINLVAPSTVNHVWHRHFADSAQVYFAALGLGHAPAANGETRWLDIGSGAGFPGLVTAILAAERGASRHILIESDKPESRVPPGSCARDRSCCGHPVYENRNSGEPR